MPEEKPIGRDLILDKVDEAVKDIKLGRGHVIGIEGEAGTGKTYLMKHILEKVRDDEDVISLMVENEAPIGKFNVSNLQPLKPFSAAMESLLEGTYKSAKDRFKKRLGISILASLPITGEIFYAVKEISKDWRDYKKDKSREKSESKVSAIDEFYDAYVSYSNKTPLVLLLDDMQWSDASSVELLRKLNEDAYEIPILIIYSYRKSDTNKPSIPLYSYILSDKSYHEKFELEGFTKNEVHQFFDRNLENYKENEDLLNWAIEKSFGNPGILNEYLRYFKKHKIFNKEGELIADLNDVSMPVSASAALASNIEDLSKDERNLLAICSSEGREFTAYMIAKLLNTDVLEVIRRLRDLAANSEIIRSTGAHIRYGVKTTVYQFTQGFYYEYFEDSLEYEEYLSLHGQIVKELKQIYDAADEEQKEMIAPYLAAHSRESENEELANEMMAVSAGIAGKYTDSNLLSGAFEGYLPEQKEESETEETEQLTTQTGVGGPGVPAIDEGDTFVALRGKVVENILENQYQQAVSTAESYYSESFDRLNLLEKIQLLSMISRSYIGIKDFDNASTKIKEAEKLTSDVKEPQAECFILNTLSLMYAEQGRQHEAIRCLRKAAMMSLSLPEELKLLTLTNISKISADTDPEKSKSYAEVARKMAENLNYYQFLEMI